MLETRKPVYLVKTKDEMMFEQKAVFSTAELALQFIRATTTKNPERIVRNFEQWYGLGRMRFGCAQ